MRSYITLASLIMVFAAILLVGVLSQLPAQAASTGTTFVVTNLQDSGSGSLRDEIDDANAQSGQSTITFYVSGTIVLSSTLPAIDKDITIDGTGHTITISGNNAVQVMMVDVSGTLHLQSVTIADGYIISSATYGDGAGIYNAGTLIVASSVFISNVADGYVYNYNNYGPKITNSPFAVNNAFFGRGGGVFNAGTLTVTDSTFSRNGAAYGGVGQSYYGDGSGIYNGGTATVISSTFLDNIAATGGGIYNRGALFLSTSTFAGNRAFYGGGVYNTGIGDGTETDATLSMINSTFSGNYGASYGNIYYGGGIQNVGTLAMTNTIIANSPTGGDCVNYGPVTGSHNLIQDTDHTYCLSDGVDGNIIGMDPLLGPLALNGNGGSTQTFALQFGSPAIDAGDDAACPPTDQRGVHRPIGAHCDIGAYEAPVMVLLLPVMRR